MGKQDEVDGEVGDELDEFEAREAASAGSAASTETPGAGGGGQQDGEGQPGDGSQGAGTAEAAAVGAATGGTEDVAAAAAALDGLLGRRVKSKGRELTVKELVESGELDKVLQTAEQLPNLQERHTEEKRRREALEAEMAKAREVEQPPRDPFFGPINQDYMRLRQGVKSNLPAAVKAGRISQELAEADPDLAADLVIGNARLDLVTERLLAIEALLDGSVKQYKQVNLASQVRGMIEKVAVEEGIPDLVAPEAREAFFDYVRGEVNLEEERLTEQMLGDLLYAYLARNPAIRERLRGTFRAKAEGTTAADRRAAGAGAGGGSAAGGRRPAAAGPGDRQFRRGQES